MLGSRICVLAGLVTLSAGCLQAELNPLSVDGEAKRIVEGTAASVGLLEFLNDVETTFEVLDLDVQLDRRAAGNLIGHRNGGDGIYGSTDDDLFGSVDEVDAVRWVGPRSLARIVGYAHSLGFVPTGSDYLGTWDNVDFTVDEALFTVSFVNKADLNYLDEDLGLDRRAVDSIAEAGVIESIAQLAELYYVGERTLTLLKEVALDDKQIDPVSTY